MASSSARSKSSNLFPSRRVGCAVICGVFASFLCGCAPGESASAEGTGGSGQTGTGGKAASGGTSGTGGASSGSGGSVGSVGSTGGSSTGGAASGGSDTGGRNTGGVSSTGGTSTGGSGTGTGGRNAGGSGSGGSAIGTGGTAGGAGRAGTGGAAGGATSTALCPTAALICEDFEDGQAQGWSALPSVMKMDTTHASSGTTSVLVDIAAGGGGGLISRKGAPLFPLVNKIMWGRVMVWFDAVADGHTDIVRGQAATGGNPAYNVAEQHGVYMMNYYNGSSATDCWARPKAPTPTMVAKGKWMCWEWKFDAGNDFMQFFVDGALYREVNKTGDGCLTGNGEWFAPADFGMVSIGSQVAEKGTAHKMWFDDIAIGTAARIGCPAP